MSGKPKAALICTHNFCRSQMAAAISKVSRQHVRCVFGKNKKQTGPDAVRIVIKVKLKLKNWHKNVLSSFVIILGGFILFNVAFLLAAFIINASQRIMGIPQAAAPHLLSRALYLILIFIISLFVLKSKLNVLVKATYLTMPLMVVLVMIGLLFYQQPKFLIVIIGTLIVSAVLLYLYKKKLPWQYYFATFYVAVLGLCIMLFNIEI